VILDTNALSAMAEGDRALEPILRSASGIAIPSIVLGEYRYGIRQSRHRAEYESWLKGSVKNCMVLNVDADTAEEYAHVREELKRIGRPIPGNDVWIAAIARQYGWPVISRDKHFDFVAKLKRIGW
jgi:tRNA(fMet)-specific endonuclease VapC